jgi:hypothetical protein
MRKKANQASGAAEIQVFELTMDNPEDQDELNRRLRKPDEPNRRPSPKSERPSQNPPTAESNGKKKGKS